VTIQSVGSGELYSTQVGNGSSVEFEINHNLGLFDTFAIVKSTASPYNVIKCKYFPISLKKSKVVFSSPPSLNQYTISVYAPLEGYSYNETIGDGSTTDFTIIHNLNTKELNVFSRDIDSPYEHTLIGWKCVSNDAIEVSFEQAPSQSSKKIYVFSSIGGYNELTDISELDNLTIESASSGDSIIYNGSLWENKSRIKTSIPSTKYGSSGDKKGDLAISSDYLYICYNNYVNNSTQIWRRVAIDTSW